MMLIPDYHLQVTFGYQIRFRAVSSGIKNVQKYRAVLGFLKQARAGLRVENHDPVPTLVSILLFAIYRSDQIPLVVVAFL